MEFSLALMYPRAWKGFSEVRYRRTRNHAFGGYESPRNVATMAANIPVGACEREHKEMSNQPNLRAGIETARGLDCHPVIAALAAAGIAGPVLLEFVERVMARRSPLAVGKED